MVRTSECRGVELLEVGCEVMDPLGVEELRGRSRRRVN